MARDTVIAKAVKKQRNGTQRGPCPAGLLFFLVIDSSESTSRKSACGRKQTFAIGLNASHFASR
jgi:hypothetical protein